MGLVAGTKLLSLRLDFVAKMASSHDATSPCDLLQGLVAGTSPIVCADLIENVNRNNNVQHFFQYAIENHFLKHQSVKSICLGKSINNTVSSQ